MIGSERFLIPSLRKSTQISAFLNHFPLGHGEMNLIKDSSYDEDDYGIELSVDIGNNK